MHTFFVYLFLKNGNFVILLQKEVMYMRNYDFHELLSAEEFEKFAASILKIRDKQKVKTNQVTKDGGIDLYFLEEHVIGQVKRYKNKASKVISSLKSEVERVKKLKPNRYIVVTSAVISKEKRETLLSMFGGYLQKEDIIDKDDLNELLVEPEYHKLEIEYLKLLVPNSFVLSHYLDTIENNKIYTQTEIELDKMKEDKKIFSVTEVFFESLDKLLREKTILITGEPGIGKSTLGRMLAAYFINSDPDTQFISIHHLEELYQIFQKDKKQVYFFDDFWGDTKYNFQITEKEKEEIINFTKYIQKLGNKWFIMTTREYILKDGIQLNTKLKDQYQFYQFTVSIDEISKTSKFNILFNHINNTKLSWSHLNILFRHWETIINNNNYNPRYIEKFLSKYEDYKDLDNLDFLYNFIDYLDNPFAFWKDTLNKQPIEVRLLLMIIALNDNDLDTKSLHKKYNNMLNKKKIENSELNDFKDLIKRMDNEFTITGLIEDKVIIKFKNPSYKDFMYDYLENNMAFYIPYIYNENLSMDELIHLWGIVNKDFELFKDLKETKELDSIIYNQIKKQDIDTKYYSMIELAEVTEFNSSSKIKDYLVSFMKESLETIEDIYYCGNNYFHLVFALLKKVSTKYDFSEYIYSLLSFLIFEQQQIYYVERLVEIKELYPSIYKDFYKEYGSDVRDFVLCSFQYNIYDCKNDEDLDSLDFILYEDIPKLYKDLGIKIPKKLTEEVEGIAKELSDEELQELKEEFSHPLPIKSKKKQKKEEDLSSVNDKIKELIGENESIDNQDKLFKEWQVSSKIKQMISKIEKDTLLENLTNYKETLYLLCQYFSDNPYPNDGILFLERFEKYLIQMNEFTEEEISELYNLSLLLVIDKKLIFKREELNSPQILYPECLDKVINSSFFIKRGEWYHFLHPIIQIHLLLELIKKYIDRITNLEVITYYLRECSPLWSDLDFNDYDDIIAYKLIEKVFPKKWNKEIRIPLYNDYLEKINRKDDMEIAKSMLKQFDFNFHYDYIYGYRPRTRVVYRNDLLLDLFIMDFDIDIIDFFIIDVTPSEETEQFFYELAEKKEELDVNKFLRKKSFLNLLQDAGIIGILNDLYQDILLKVSEEVVNCE